MRHQSHYIPLAIANAGNVVARTVWIRGVSHLSVRVTIAKNNSLFALQLSERRIVADKVSFRMGNRHAQHKARLQLVCEWCLGILDSHVYVIADEMQIAIANQRAGQQAGFAQNLKAVANPQHQISFRGEFFHRIHHRGKPRQGPGAQIISVRKTPGNDHGVITGKIGFAMPDEIDWLAYVFRDHVICVVIAI